MRLRCRGREDLHGQPARAGMAPSAREVGGFTDRPRTCADLHRRHRTGRFGTHSAQHSSNRARGRYPGPDVPPHPSDGPCRAADRGTSAYCSWGKAARPTDRTRGPLFSAARERARIPWRNSRFGDLNCSRTSRDADSARLLIESTLLPDANSGRIISPSPITRRFAHTNHRISGQ